MNQFPTPPLADSPRRPGRKPANRRNRTWERQHPPVTFVGVPLEIREAIRNLSAHYREQYGMVGGVDAVARELLRYALKAYAEGQVDMRPARSQPRSELRGDSHPALSRQSIPVHKPAPKKRKTAPGQLSPAHRPGRENRRDYPVGRRQSRAPGHPSDARPGRHPPVHPRAGCLSRRTVLALHHHRKRQCRAEGRGRPMSKLPRSAKCEMFFGKVKNWFAAAANQPQTNRKPDANQDANHAADLRQFADWFEQANGEALRPERITPSDVKRYKDFLLNSQRRAASTINRRLAAISALPNGRWLPGRFTTTRPCISSRLRKWQARPNGWTNPNNSPATRHRKGLAGLAPALPKTLGHPPPGCVHHPVPAQHRPAPGRIGKPCAWAMCNCLSARVCSWFRTARGKTARHPAQHRSAQSPVRVAGRAS
jgi:hypothetical protein